MGMRDPLILAVTLSLLCMAGCAARTTRGEESDKATALALADESARILAEALKGDSGTALRHHLGHAKGMMIIPAAGDVSFIFSVGGGNATLMANTDEGWTGPVFLTRSTIGYGWQAGISKHSGILLFMHEDDVRYVMETGAVLQGQARLVFLNVDQQFNETPEFYESGNVYFVGDRAGLYAGVAVNSGGYSDRTVLNEAFTGLPGGGPRAILYDEKNQPEGAARLRGLLGEVASGVDATKQKDGTEVPSD